MSVLRDMVKPTRVCKATRNSEKIIKGANDDSLYVKNYDKIKSLQKNVESNLRQAHTICKDAIKLINKTKMGCKGDWDDLNACDEWLDYFSEILGELYDTIDNHFLRGI